MLELLSIGPACGVRQNINLYYYVNRYQEATFFFDWLLSQFDDVLKLLDIDNIDDILNIDSFVYKKDQGTVFTKLSNNVISVHDKINETSEKESYIALVEKYKRRYVRFINRIKTSTDTVFIYQGDVTIEQLNSFFQKLDLIHPNNNFRLMLVGDGPCKIDLHPRSTYVNRLLFRRPGVPESWEQYEYDWIRMIQTMEK